MEKLDLLIRGAAIGAIGLVVLRPLIGPGPRRKPLAVAALGLSVICYLLVSPPWLAGPFEPVLALGAVLAPVALTWAVFEIFHDRPTGHLPWLALAAATAPAAFAAAHLPVLGLVRGGMVAVLYVGLLGVAIWSDPDDLVESRRRFRRVFVVAMALLGVAITAVEVLVDPADVPPVLLPLQASAVLILTVAYGWWTLQPSNQLWPEARPAPAPPPAAGPSDLAERLAVAMAAGAWRQEGLTIGALATKLDVPEHRLRAVINGELGFRNFSSYVNGHRIRAARAALTDPAREGATVLEIAYETGFASLGPFNRAFRAETGQSPTEYRQARHAAGKDRA